jgi:Zn ribbon nucleic-acid-binding protein
LDSSFGKGGFRGISIVKMKPDIELEEVVCPLCKASSGIPIHREGSFQMVKCPSCQFIYLNPRPTNEALHEFYQQYLPEEEPSNGQPICSRDLKQRAD